MSTSYGRLAFTDAVQRAQERHGSRRFYARHQKRLEASRHRNGGGDSLTDEVRSYLADRDSFYLATVSETSWPYVQYRGGPPGFLRVLSDHTVGWADFRGTLQYISTGNLSNNDRVALIVMDYPTRQRLKIYGRAAVSHAGEGSNVVAELTDRRYEAVVERGVVVTVEAFDWNCQQHITPRYTQEELQPRLDPLLRRMEASEAANVELRRLQAAAT